MRNLPVKQIKCEKNNTMIFIGFVICMITNINKYDYQGQFASYQSDRGGVSQLCQQRHPTYLPAS